MTKFAEHFTNISVEAAKEQLQTADEFILFIGRPTCPFCRRFEPKLSHVAKETN